MRIRYITFLPTVLSKVSFPTNKFWVIRVIPLKQILSNVCVNVISFPACVKYTPKLCNIIKWLPNNDVSIEFGDDTNNNF